MAFEVFTDGYEQSVGSVQMYGSWSGSILGLADFSFQWGYGSYSNTTSVVQSSEEGGSYSRTPAVGKDRTIRFRAKGKRLVDNFIVFGAGSGDFKTYADPATFPTGLTAGAPTINSVPVSGSVNPKTDESSGSVYIEYRVLGAGSWTTVPTPIATGLSGGSGIGLSGTLSGLASGTTYEARFRIDRSTVNQDQNWSAAATFTTTSAAATVVSPQLIIGTGSTFLPTRVGASDTITSVPAISEALGEMFVPDVIITTKVDLLDSIMLGTGEMFAPELRLTLGSVDEFLKWPDRREIVIAEVTPSLTLRTWTKTPGFSNVWEIVLSNLFTAGSFAGGVYRRVVGVRENGTDLVERSSAVSVQTTLSSWFWDEANGTLYVRTSSSTAASPDTFTAYQAFVTYYIATEGVVFERDSGDPDTAVYYHPWLSGNLPRISQYMEDPLLGIKVTEGGTIGFTNTHGFFNHAIPGHNWKNKRVKLLLGGVYNGLRLQRSQYATLTTMLVDDISADEEAASMALKAMPKLLDLQLPITPYFETAYPFLGQGVRGTKKWLGWGRGTVPPDLTDTSGLGVWTVADAAFQTLTTVHNVWAQNKTTGVRTSLPASDYTVNLTTCTITVTNATYTWQSYQIVADVTGKAIHTFGGIVRDILQAHLGVPDAELDLASFTAADADAPQLLGVWVKEERSIASILATTEREKPSLERSALGNLQYTPEGKWRVQIWSPGYDAATTVSLRREDFAGFAPEPKLETAFSTSRAHYNFDHAAQAWSVSEASDAAIEFLNETKDRLDVYTFIREESAALVLAQRAQLLAGSSPLEIEFKERGALLSRARAGSVVLVTYDPIPLVGGVASAKAFELLRLDRSLSPTFTVTGRLGDLRGISSTIGHWTAEGAPRWDQATEAEKATQGFWTDGNGFADPADLTSTDRSAWW